MLGLQKIKLQSLKPPNFCHSDGIYSGWCDNTCLDRGFCCGFLLNDRLAFNFIKILFLTQNLITKLLQFPKKHHTKHFHYILHF